MTETAGTAGTAGTSEAVGRARSGRAVRKRLPRSSHGAWEPARDRPDPVAVLAAQGADRVAELLPIRYGRMAASPFAFLRGAAAVMASDLGAEQHTGLTVQLCGDAHLVNFGVFGSPERALLFDLNDFDETLPGPFEWDLKRLAASIAVAAQDNGAGQDRARRTVLAAAAAYRRGIQRLASSGELAVWYERITSEDILPLLPGRADRRRARARLDQARHRDNLQALGKLTEVVDGHRRIVSDPPLLEPGDDGDAHIVRTVLDGYRTTLPEERRQLLDRYRFLGAARKVVGVGSVGTRCFIALLEGRGTGDPLFLQVKEAGPSVLEQHLPASAFEHQGQRVVVGQRILQSASDIFLGWTTGPEGRHFYCRQLRDMKGSVVVADMAPHLLTGYAALCGSALARAHARSGDRLAIAGYLGEGDRFDRAIAEFALRYAEQNRVDHAALLAAVATGRITAEDC